MRSLDDDSRLTHFGDHPCHFSRYSTLPCGEREEREKGGWSHLEEMLQSNRLTQPALYMCSGAIKTRATVCQQRETVALKSGPKEGGRLVENVLPFRQWFSEGWRQWQRVCVASQQQLFGLTLPLHEPVSTFFEYSLEHSSGWDRWGHGGWGGDGRTCKQRSVAQR